jgi:CRISPR/Cas system-associated exonuclease Cas4 (RecB family)
MTAWSYSSIKTFDQCPKKYFHLKVAKDVKDEGNEASIYGNDAHEAAEHYIKHGTPIPDKFAIMRPVVEALAKFPGEKHTELKLGVRKSEDGFEPCGFFDKDVWYRGIVDLLIVDGTTAHMVDYKTGKKPIQRYEAEKRFQLTVYADLVQSTFNEPVSAAELLYLKEGIRWIIHPSEEDVLKMREVVTNVWSEIQESCASGSFEARLSKLCNWCNYKSFCPAYKG